MDLPASSSRDTNFIKEHIEQNDFKHVLPPEYDKNDSRWTLKYREPAPGLVELIKHSGVYVNADALAECEKWSDDCKTFARMLLTEIFTANALSLCKLGNNFGIGKKHDELELDSHATVTLLKFVAEYGLEQNWEVNDYDCMLNGIRSKLVLMATNRFPEEKRIEERSGYDKSRWTLKYRKPAPGLVELMAHSGVYVTADILDECKTLLKKFHEKELRCELIGMLVSEVFTRYALRVCTFPASLGNALRIRVEHDKPKLSTHAITTLVNFIAEYGLEKDCKDDHGVILKDIYSSIHNMRMSAGRWMERNHKRTIVLPPEYDENDTRWTLKYREPAPELVELMERSGVYVNADKLAEFKKKSKYSEFTIVDFLLCEVFTTFALSICTVPAAICIENGFRVEPNRPALDLHATKTIQIFFEDCLKKNDLKQSKNSFSFLVRHRLRALQS